MKHLAVMIIATLAVAAAALGAPPRTAPRSVIESEPFTITARLPEGWTVEDARIVPPASLRSSCQVHWELIRDRDWNTALASVVRDSAPASRALVKIGGHAALDVQSGAGAGSRSSRSYYINLDDIEPATFSIWTFEGDNSSAGHECQMGFMFLVQSLSIERPH